MKVAFVLSTILNKYSQNMVYQMNYTQIMDHALVLKPLKHSHKNMIFNTKPPAHITHRAMGLLQRWEE
jgi:hypothetical protein